IPQVFNGYTKFLTGKSMVVNGNISNNALAEITSFDATYTRGVTTYTQSFTGLSIGGGEAYSFIFDSPLSINEGTNTVNISISNINGGASDDPSDNTQTATITGVTAKPGRVVVAEEATGSWCGWCVRGNVMMEHMNLNYPEYFASIAVHNGDPMAVAEYDNGLNATGFPSAKVDRQAWIDPLQFETAFMDRIGLDPEVIVSNTAAYTEGTGMVSITSTLNVQEELNGDYRIAVVLTEDEVSGTGSSWNQSNYYSGGSYGPMGGYESLGSSVSSTAIPYMHVARAIIGGFNGAAGSIPENNPAGSEHTYTVEYELPENYNWENMHAITLVIKFSTKKIINAGTSSLIASSADNISSFASVNLYPNPA
ncbi:MAG: Omp28-related outer membrane protein, partial [Chitinophagales bacterium]